MDISRLGVFAFLDSMEGAESGEFARRVERQGYSVLWIVEASGRNSLSFAPWLLARTESLVVATGVASVWARAASTMAAGARTAGSDAHGTITYFVTPEHTARAREIIGPNLWLCAVQAVMLERDAARARTAARSYMKLYLRIPAYLKNLRTLGFDGTDFSAGASNRLADTIVAWGSEARLRDRIESHYEAGATHVCVLALSPEGGLLPDPHALEALAPK
jgi:hypothetical protein